QRFAGTAMTIRRATALRDERVLRQAGVGRVTETVALERGRIRKRGAVLERGPDRTGALPAGADRVTVELEILFRDADERGRRDRIRAQDLARDGARQLERARLLERRER